MIPGVSHASLKDGTRVTLRPIRPDDAASAPAFDASVSAASRRMRFHSSVPGLTPGMVEAATGVDYSRDMALVAIAMDGDLERPLGVARYARLPDGITAEFAIVLADSAQRRGLGEAMMRRLLELAGDAGIAQLVGWVLAENAGMLALCRRLGFEVRRVPGDPTVREVVKATQRFPG